MATYLRDLISTEQREHALDILRKKGRRGLRQVNKLLGRSDLSMDELAAFLDLTKRELRDLLLGEELRKARREARAAQERAKDVELLRYMSHEAVPIARQG